jgi:hypothetical protein
MRLLRQRAAELSSPPPPTRSNRPFAQGLDAESLLLECTDAIMSSQCTTHRSPSSACMCPSARNAVRLAVFCLVVRVPWFCLYTQPSPHTSHFLSAEEGGGGQNVQGRAVAVHHHSKITPRPTRFPIHFDCYYLICLSSIFPSC